MWCAITPNACLLPVYLDPDEHPLKYTKDSMSTQCIPLATVQRCAFALKLYTCYSRFTYQPSMLGALHMNTRN